ncbi:peptidase [Alteromonas sediminis]|uniref:Peptidase n=1 Tax=Alteromonas sediminis TaxID=2259342 RepID=A0A3N5Y9P0_9ALTE|nr:S41 family peptidase [Alteromonas sediminis]RPJ65385.1 peptidase [Alteromonas sediminis]
MTGRQKGLLALAPALLVLGLAGCGGGGGGSASTPTPPTPTPPPPPPPDPDPQPTWVQGEFAAQTEFKDRCATPRTGTNPFTNQPYPDVEGSELEEKMWLRSFTYDTYLWFDEVPDNDPNDFEVLPYFDQLKTTELTASGKPKDNFHFYQDTAEYLERTQGGVSSGYGIAWEFIRTTPPRVLTVRYTEPGSPADVAGISRGESVVEVNGADFVNSNSQADIDLINAALFPSQDGETYTFVLENPEGERTTYEITSGEVVISPVQNTQVLDTAQGKVGYFQFNTFIPKAQEGLIAAFNSFVDENITDLVIDLRYNGGGRVALSSQLAYMVAGPVQTNGLLFERNVTNGKLQGNETPFYSREIDYEQGFLLNTELPSPSLTRVYVLTTDSTCSASESLINGLRGIDVEVVQIGGTTCGKPFGFVPEDNCGITYFTIQVQGQNDKGFGDFQEGFSAFEDPNPNFQDQLPGCVVEDDLTKPLGDPSEAMLSAALGHMVSGECPAVRVGKSSSAQQAQLTNGESGLSIKQPNVMLDAIINDVHDNIVDPQ